VGTPKPTQGPPELTEAEARELLRRCDGPGGLEAWIARQSWRTVPGGWAVRKELEGWRFRLEAVPEGVRVIAGMPDAEPAVWVVEVGKSGNA
jgi:hypothetical protein